MKNIKQISITLIALGVLSLPLVFRPYVVAGISMEPTYEEGQTILINTLGWRVLGIERGDVVIVRNPHDTKVTEIKRVIGLPGEGVEMTAEGISVTSAKGEEVFFERGTVVGGAHNDPFSIQLGPEDYFLLGDNRPQSADSRVFGAAQRADFIGRVLLTL